MKKLNLKYIKVPSPEIHNIKLLKAVNGSFDYVIASRHRNLEEVKKVKIINKSKLILLHCVSAYPAINNINLPRIFELKKINNKVGYSGHLPGVFDAIASLNYHPEFIEKHFTIDNKLPVETTNLTMPAELKYLVNYKNSLSHMNTLEVRTFKY